MLCHNPFPLFGLIHVDMANQDGPGLTKSRQPLPLTITLLGFETRQTAWMLIRAAEASVKPALRIAEVSALAVCRKLWRHARKEAATVAARGK